jgi:hypothetical protein
MRRLQHCLLTFCALLVCAGLGMAATACASPSPTTLTSSGAELPAVQPADFGFVASYGAYGKNQLDTFKGTFTKDIISQTKPNPTVELRLTAEELATLYQDLRAMHVLDYPDSLDPSNTGVTASTPTSYRLEMRVGGLAKTVSYVHGDSPKTEQAKALADWFEKLRAIIEAKPEYQQMPPLEGGYAWLDR